MLAKTDNVLEEVGVRASHGIDISRVESTSPSITEETTPLAHLDFEDPNKGPIRLSWNEFNSKVGGYGYSKKQISRLYRKYLDNKGIVLGGQSKRLKYLGNTPGKSSSTGQAVIDRMRSQGRIRDLASGVFVKDANGKWYPLAEMDMGHLTEAVHYWNTKGIKYGPRSPEVRKWMLDPNKYELQHFSRNRSDGAQLGINYIDP
jgi:hypothetical protein